ncbi:MAG: helix-turn-helix transcriptional regulator [Clostridia bacterium]|nr:helix-turn-helix transcriptional regulator [Clostridia bacterium]
MTEYSISEKLSELRAAKGVTQDEVANALSISNKTVSKWENGMSEPDLTMLIALAHYYNVTTDTLLGLEEGKKGMKQMLGDQFRDLDLENMARKAFAINREMIPIGFYTARKDEGDSLDKAILPFGTEKNIRSLNSFGGLFQFAVCSKDVNFSVVQLSNEADFSWLTDEKKQKRMSELFALLSDADMLKMIYFIQSKDCSPRFTAGYLSAHTDIPLEKTLQLLEKCMELELGSQMTAHLKDGDTVIYEFICDGLLLSLLSVAYERMWGRKCYDYCWNVGSKMIGGKKG